MSPLHLTLKIVFLRKTISPPGSKMIGHTMGIGLTIAGVDRGRALGTMDMATMVPGANGTTTMEKREGTQCAGRTLSRVGSDQRLRVAHVIEQAQHAGP